MRAAGNQRDSPFLRCTRADTDPRFVRYPTLPMRTCAGYEEAMLFIVLLHYTKPLDAVDAVRADHLRHSETHAARGVFHAWAPLDPAALGEFLATTPTRAAPVAGVANDTYITAVKPLARNGMITSRH